MDSPFAVGFPELMLVAIIALIILGWREPPAAFWRQLRGQLDQLGYELDRRIDRRRWMRRLPVFSAETIHGIRGAWISEEYVVVENDAITEFRVTMRVSFVLD